MDIDNYFGMFFWITLGCGWFTISFLSVFAMICADIIMAITGKINPTYWFKGKKGAQWEAMMYIFIGPFAFISGIVATLQIISCLKLVKEEKTITKPRYNKRK